MARQRAFTDGELDELCYRALRGDEGSLMILKDEYEGMVKRIGFYACHTIDDIRMKYIKKTGRYPTRPQLKVVSAILGITEYVVYHYKHKNVMFERDYATKRIIRKIRDVEKIGAGKMDDKARSLNKESEGGEKNGGNRGKGNRS